VAVDDSSSFFRFKRLDIEGRTRPEEAQEQLVEDVRKLEKLEQQKTEDYWKS